MIATTLVLAASLLTGGPAETLHREKVYFLKGTLGNDSISMKIELFDEMWFARYFFLKNRKDIVLQGSCDSTACTFSITRWDGKKGREIIMEVFNIKETEEHHWKGEWMDQEKKVRNVFLKPIDRDSVAHLCKGCPAIDKMDTYSYFRTSGIPFMKSRTEMRNGKTIDWFKDKTTGIEMPRLGKGFTALQQERTNRTLQNLHLKEIENHLSCSSFDYNGRYKVYTRLKFVNKDLISMVMSVEFNCHRTFPTVNDVPLTINVNTGDVLSLEELFWFGPSGGAKPIPETEEWYQYRYHLFGAAVLAILKKMYPENINDDHCNYTDAKAWQFPTWYLTPEGLYLGAVMPGIDRSCDHPAWPIIPYDELAAYQNNIFHFGEKSGK